MTRDLLDFLAMTNCGAWGWVTDKTAYRYDALYQVTAETVMPQRVTADRLGACVPDAK
jgi:alkylated DNA repair dioxygenase AlkB